MIWVRRCGPRGKQIALISRSFVVANAASETTLGRRGRGVGDESADKRLAAPPFPFDAMRKSLLAVVDGSASSLLPIYRRPVRSARAAPKTIERCRHRLRFFRRSQDLFPRTPQRPGEREGIEVRRESGKKLHAVRSPSRCFCLPASPGGGKRKGRRDIETWRAE
ncbi:hypothetical protein MRX96_026860 [Rhipicephalus microplus]